MTETIKEAKHKQQTAEEIKTKENTEVRTVEDISTVQLNYSKAEKNETTRRYLNLIQDNLL